VTREVAPGWYPDYEAPPGHQRYWDGERWTERRTTAPAGPATRHRIAVWAVSAIVLVIAAALVAAALGSRDQVRLQDGGPAPSVDATALPGDPGDSADPGDPGEAGAPEPGRRTWAVASVVDGTTLELTTGARVRLLGLADSCSVAGLAALTEGQTVTLTRRGPDKDADGALLRYVERDGLDVGLRLLQRGWATASAEPHARGARYRGVDGRSEDRCG
jgi:endonuclease YncB( thermonuclease family)